MKNLTKVLFLFIMIVAFAITANALSLTNVGFTADNVTMSGNTANGFVLSTNNNATQEHLIQFASNTVADQNLTSSYFGLYVISSSVSNITLNAYYDARGVPEPFLTYLKNAADGINPFAYIKGNGIDGNVTLIDAAKHDIIATDVPMTIPDDYPLGNYTVSGNITNTTFDNATVTFKLIVADTVVPVITLLGSNPVTVLLNLTNSTAYTDAGANATDNYNGNITANIVTVNPVNTSVLGTYTVTYNVKDSSNNSATQVTRTVNVVSEYDVLITPTTALKFNFSNKGEYFTKTISIQNTGGLTLTNLAFNGAGIGSAYKFNLTDSDQNGSIVNLTSLAPGAVWTVTAKGLIPENADEYLGTVLFTSDQKSGSINFEIVETSMLIIKTIKFVVDDTSQTLNTEDEDVSERANPESDIEMTINIENLYPSRIDSDISEITDITATLTIPEFAEDNDDFELEADTFDLKAGNTDSETLTFTVPLRVKEGTFDATIDIEGDDGDGFTHTDSWTITFTVDKKTHEIRITNMIPLELECSRDGTVDFSLVNTGTNSENDMIITAQNSALGLDYKKDKVDLGTNSWDDDLQEISVPVNAEDVKAETYKVNVKVYLDNNDYLNSDYSAVGDINVVVKDCGSETPTMPTIPTIPVVISPPVQPTPTTPTEPIIPVEQTPEIPFTETSEYIALLVLANLTGLGIFGAIMAKFILLLRL